MSKVTSSTHINANRGSKIDQNGFGMKKGSVGSTVKGVMSPKSKYEMGVGTNEITEIIDIKSS